MAQHLPHLLRPFSRGSPDDTLTVAVPALLFSSPARAATASCRRHTVSLPTCGWNGPLSASPVESRPCSPAVFSFSLFLVFTENSFRPETGACGGEHDCIQAPARPPSGSAEPRAMATPCQVMEVVPGAVGASRRDPQCPWGPRLPRGAGILKPDPRRCPPGFSPVNGLPRAQAERPVRAWRSDTQKEAVNRRLWMEERWQTGEGGRERRGGR